MTDETRALENRSEGVPDSTASAEVAAEVTALRAELIEMRREALAARYGIPAEVAGLLRAETPEAMEREAAALAAAIGSAAIGSAARGSARLGRGPGNPGIAWSAGHAAEAGGPDLGWIRERRTGTENPFRRGGVLWAADSGEGGE